VASGQLKYLHALCEQSTVPFVQTGVNWEVLGRFRPNKILLALLAGAPLACQGRTALDMGVAAVSSAAGGAGVGAGGNSAARGSGGSSGATVGGAGGTAYRDTGIATGGTSVDASTAGSSSIDAATADAGADPLPVCGDIVCPESKRCDTSTSPPTCVCAEGFVDDVDRSGACVSLGAFTAANCPYHASLSRTPNGLKLEPPVEVYLSMGSGGSVHVSGAQGHDYWLEDGSVEPWLPIVVGSLDADGHAEGDTRVFDNADAVRSLIASDTTDTHDHFLQEALILKLNLAYTQSRGERLLAGYVYGSHAAIRDISRYADSAIRGPFALIDPKDADRAALLMHVVDLAEVTYIQPHLRSLSGGGDRDGDGIIDTLDNCPWAANPLQEDYNYDDQGDACDIIPHAQCALDRGGGNLTAFFGYFQPAEAQSLTVGTRNYFVPDPQDRQQPDAFCAGPQDRAFGIDITEGETLTWQVRNSGVDASAALPRCLGLELANVEFAPNTALFASERMTLGQGAIVGYAADDFNASVVCGTTLEAAASVQLGNAWSRGDAHLGLDAHVHGVLVSGGALIDDGATRDATLAEHAYVPRHSQQWQVDFPEPSTLVANVSQGNMTLPPGDYSSLGVTAASTVLLRSGVYRFNRVELADGARIQCIGTVGPTTLYVRDTMDLAATSHVDCGPEQLFVGYFGSRLDLELTEFTGTVVAPRASLTLAGTTAFGRFFAREVIVGPATRVYLKP
jgi:hypothetical protein